LVRQKQQQEQPASPQQLPMQQSQDDEWFSDEDEPVSPAATTGSPANILYDFEGLLLPLLNEAFSACSYEKM